VEPYLYVYEIKTPHKHIIGMVTVSRTILFHSHNESLREILLNSFYINLSCLHSAHDGLTLNSVLED